MLSKKQTRLRRARKTRGRIERLNSVRLSVHRTTQHIYAQLIDTQGNVKASASTLHKSFKEATKGQELSKTDEAKVVGKQMAEAALAQGINRASFDRSGFKFHGRVKALADSLKENGFSV